MASQRADRDPPVPLDQAVEVHQAQDNASCTALGEAQQPGHVGMDADARRELALEGRAAGRRRRRRHRAHLRQEPGEALFDERLLGERRARRRRGFDRRGIGRRGARVLCLDGAEPHPAGAAVPGLGGPARAGVPRLGARLVPGLVVLLHGRLAGVRGVRGALHAPRLRRAPRGVVRPAARRHLTVLELLLEIRPSPSPASGGGHGLWLLQRHRCVQ
mmetsp:Transcript_106294/g.288426  ORF Transcript_106294/g.288426 Transcript_106294/m.288426 type:complete len:217 (-) Transcript_106294:64-714(-)